MTEANKSSGRGGEPGSGDSGSTSATATATPAPTYSQDSRSIAVQTPLGKDAVLLRSFRGEEGISRLFRFELELLSERASLDVSALMGKAATVGVRLHDGTDRFFNGVVSRISLVGGEGRFTLYRAELVPWTWLLTRTSDCRVFQGLSIPAIVEKVFKDHGFQDFKNRVQKTYPPREYTVQYRETDFNFVSRLMEQCGIFYFFEHENGKHTLVMADAAAEHKPCPVVSEVRFRALKPEAYEKEVVASWSLAYEIRPNKYSLAAYNFETPNANMVVNVEAVHPTEGARTYEVYDYPGDFQKRADGESLVGVRIEEQEAQLVIARGATTCRTLAAGYKFDLIEHPHAPINQSYLITAVSHSVAEPSYVPREEEADARYRNNVIAMPFTVPFRPARVTPRPVIHGVQTAMVVGKKGEDLWVDKHGRVKVQFHWDREGARDENSSCWIRVSQNWAGKRWGAVFLPRIGQEVIVDFLEGDPDCPIITGRVYNGDQTPPYDLPGEQTKTALKSNSSKGGGGFNELRFEDKKGAEQVFIHGQKDLDLVIEVESRELVIGDRHTIVEHARFDQVGMEQHLKIGGDLVEEVDGVRFIRAKKGLSVKAGARIVLDSDAEITLKAPGGFIVLGTEGITIQGTVVNINSGGTAAAAATKAAKLPHRASSAGAGGEGIPPGGGGTEPQDPDIARVELYRDTYEENKDKMSESDRKEYELALAELEDATKRKDKEGIAAAKAKLDAILQKNGIAIPPDPAVVPGVPGGTSPGAGGTAAKRTGLVRAEGRCFADDQGQFRPLGATLFWAPRGWKFEQARVRQNLAFLQRHRWDYIRVLCEVGWKDHEIDPTWPDYQQVLGGLIDAAYDEYGLRTELTLIGGGTNQDPVGIAQKVMEVARTRAPKIIHFEAANESYQNLPDVTKVRSVAKVLRASPNLVAVSAPSIHSLEGNQALMQGDVGNMATPHFDRTFGDDDWRFVRQVWDAIDWPWPTSNNEGKGPASSVSATSDPLRLAMYRAMSIMCGIGAFVLHNGAGIYGFAIPDRGRTPNLWEMPNIDAIMDAVRGVDTLIPVGVENWVNANDGWTPPNPVHPLQVAEWTDQVGPIKNHAARAGNQFVSMPHGVRNRLVLEAKEPLSFKAYNPITRAVVAEATLAKGQQVTLPGPANTRDCAYIIVGQLG